MLVAAVHVLVHLLVLALLVVDLIGKFVQETVVVGPVVVLLVAVPQDAEGKALDAPVTSPFAEVTALDAKLCGVVQDSGDLDMNSYVKNGQDTITHLYSSAYEEAANDQRAGTKVSWYGTLTSSSESSSFLRFSGFESPTCQQSEKQ